eukprot:jgi/Hompol1/4642/HPOL_003776-RA
MLAGARQFDIVVWGATGFTGSLVVEYLLKSSQTQSFKFAIAGRSKTKLDQVLVRAASRAGVVLNASNTPAILLADAADVKSLDELTASTKVVLTTVGPYALYGFPLVESCVRNKTDYVDLTGEPHFIRQTAQRLHADAQRNGSLIVHACGFDSIPSDLGVFLAANHFATKGLKLQSAKLSMLKLSGGASGGTLASGIGAIETLTLREISEISSNAHYCIPESKQIVRSKTVNMTFDNDFNSWQTIFFMNTPNSHIVQRSNYLLNYGPLLSYYETMRASNVVTAAVVAAVTAIVPVLLWFPPIRWIVQKVMPPGSGPSDEVIKKGHFTSCTIGYSTPNDQGKELKAQVTVKGVSDPGYGETAKMISEAALCLALDRSKASVTGQTGSFQTLSGGVATPASAMGMLLVNRLRKAGMTFDVSEIA